MIVSALRLRASHVWAILLCALGISLVGTAGVRAQTASVRGVVLDGETGRPLSGANVGVLQENEVVRGTASGREGSFLITELSPGRYVFEVTFVGYRPYRDTLRLLADESREIEARLTPVAEELREVRIEAEDDAGATAVEAGYQRLEAEDLERVPTPGLSADLASYMTTQPGVVSLGDRGGGLYIRGGEPSQNRLYVDRIPLLQPFHMIGFYSAVPSTIVQQTDLYAGGYPSGYNGGLSSIIDVGSRTGNMREYEGSATVSPFISSVSLNGPVYPQRVSFLGSLRHSTLEQGASRYVDQPLPFEFADAFGKLYGRISPTKRLVGSGIWSTDTGTLASAGRDSVAREMRWTNSGASLRYLAVPSSLPIRAEGFIAYSQLRSELGPIDEPLRTSSVQNTRVGAEAHIPGESVSAVTGFTADFVNVDTKMGHFFDNIRTGVVASFVQTGLYVTPTFKFLPGNRLTIEPGLRGHFYNVRFDPYVEPRLRINYEIANQEVSFAGGLFHQEMLGLADRRDAASVFTAWTLVPHRRAGVAEGLNSVLFKRLGRAYHVAGSYRIRPSPSVELALEGFYRHYANLFVQEWSSQVEFSPRLQPATGRSLGGNVRLEVQKGPFYGFLNYGYSNTRYKAENAKFELWYGDETLDFRPPHDQRHQVNGVLEVEKWGYTLNLRWSAASGRPYSRPIGFDGFVVMSAVRSQFRTDGDERVIYEEPFNAALPPFHRLDVSLERTFELTASTELTVQGSVINAYDRSNIFYLDLFTQERENQLPFVPTLGLGISINE